MDQYEAKTMDIEGKAYVPVHERIKEFYSKYPFGSIKASILSDIKTLKEGDVIVVKGLAFRYPNDPNPGIGHSQATHGKDYFKTSALEIAETSAIGRALGMMGIGIKGVMASADEVEKSTEQKQAQDKASEKTTSKKVVDEKPDKKLPNYNLLKYPEKGAAELIAETIKAAGSRKELGEIAEKIREAKFSSVAIDELRKERNNKVRELNSIKE